MPRSQLFWKTLEKSGLEMYGANSSYKHCALSTQPNPYLPSTVDGDLDESIKRNSSDRLGELVPRGSSSDISNFFPNIWLLGIFLEIFFSYNTTLSYPGKPFSFHFFFFALTPISLSHVDFVPVISLGCWSIQTQLKAGITGNFAPFLPPHRANPGKCAIYCRNAHGVKTKYGALTKGGTCYCINQYISTDGSSNTCDDKCGKHLHLWPGYLCGSSKQNEVVNVYQEIKGRWLENHFFCQVVSMTK